MGGGYNLYTTTPPPLSPLDTPLGLFTLQHPRWLTDKYGVSAGRSPLAVLSHRLRSRPVQDGRIFSRIRRLWKSCRFSLTCPGRRTNLMCYAKLRPFLSGPERWSQWRSTKYRRKREHIHSIPTKTWSIFTSTGSFFFVNWTRHNWATAKIGVVRVRGSPYRVNTVGLNTIDSFQDGDTFESIT